MNYVKPVKIAFALSVNRIMLYVSNVKITIS